MNKPVELLQRIQTGFAYQILVRKRLEQAKLKIDRDIIARELSESCEYLIKLDCQLTELIEAENKKMSIIFRSNAA